MSDVTDVKLKISAVDEASSVFKKVAEQSKWLKKTPWTPFLNSPDDIGELAGLSFGKAINRGVDKSAVASGGIFNTLAMHAKQMQRERKASGEIALEKMLKTGYGLGAMGLGFYALQHITAMADAVNKLSVAYGSGTLSAEQYRIEVAKQIPLFGTGVALGESIRELATGVEQYNARLEANQRARVKVHEMQRDEALAGNKFNDRMSVDQGKRSLFGKYGAEKEFATSNINFAERAMNLKSQYQSEINATLPQVNELSIQINQAASQHNQVLAKRLSDQRAELYKKQIRLAKQYFIEESSLEFTHDYDRTQIAVDDINARTQLESQMLASEHAMVLQRQGNYFSAEIQLLRENAEAEAMAIQGNGETQITQRAKILQDAADKIETLERQHAFERIDIENEIAQQIAETRDKAAVNDLKMQGKTFTADIEAIKLHGQERIKEVDIQTQKEIRNHAENADLIRKKAEAKKDDIRQEAYIAARQVYANYEQSTMGLSLPSGSESGRLTGARMISREHASSQQRQTMISLLQELNNNFKASFGGSMFGQGAGNYGGN